MAVYPFVFLFVLGFKGGHHSPIFVDNLANKHRYQRSQFSRFIVLSTSFPTGKPFRNNLLFYSEGQHAACPPYHWYARNKIKIKEGRYESKRY